MRTLYVCSKNAAVYNLTFLAELAFKGRNERERERDPDRKSDSLLACLPARSPSPFVWVSGFDAARQTGDFFVWYSAFSTYICNMGPQGRCPWNRILSWIFFWIKGNLEECERASRYIGTWVIGEKMLTIRWSCCYCFRVESALLVSVE